MILVESTTYKALKNNANFKSVLVEESYREVVDLHLERTNQLGFANDLLREKINSALSAWDQFVKVPVRQSFGIQFIDALYFPDLFRITRDITSFCAANNLLFDDPIPLSETNIPLANSDIFNLFLNEIKSKLQVFTPNNTPTGLLLAYGKKVFAEEIFSFAKDDAQQSFFQCLYELYPIWSTLSLLCTDSNISLDFSGSDLLENPKVVFPNPNRMPIRNPTCITNKYAQDFTLPLPYSKSINFLIDTKELFHERLANSFKDQRFSIPIAIKSLEFEYKYVLDNLIRHFILLHLGNERSLEEIEAETRIVEAFKKDYLSFIGLPLFGEPSHHGDVAPIHDQLEPFLINFYAQIYIGLNLHSLASLKREGKDYFLTEIRNIPESPFFNASIANNFLDKVRSAYVHFTGKEIDEGQKEIEKDVVEKIALFYAASDARRKNLAIAMFSRATEDDLSDLLHFWEINQQNKKDLVDELNNQNALRSSEFLAEQEAQEQLSAEEKEARKLLAEREQVYNETYDELHRTMEQNFADILARIQEAKEVRVSGIIKKYELMEAIEVEKQEKEFQIEIKGLLKKLEEADAAN